MKANIQNARKRRARRNLPIMAHQHTYWTARELIPLRILQMFSKTRMARIVRSTTEESRIPRHRKRQLTVHLRTPTSVFMEFHQLKVDQNETQEGLLKKPLRSRDKTNCYPVRYRISKQIIQTITHYHIQDGPRPLQSTVLSREPLSLA